MKKWKFRSPYPNLTVLVSSHPRVVAEFHDYTFETVSKWMAEKLREYPDGLRRYREVTEDEK